jgi:hypothetical protein
MRISKIDLWSKNWYKKLTSLMLGGSESGTNFLSLKNFEGTFSSLPDEIPGIEIRHDVCIDFTGTWNNMTLLPLLGDCQFLLLNWKIPENKGDFKHIFSTIYDELKEQKLGIYLMMLKQFGRLHGHTCLAWGPPAFHLHFWSSA